MPTQLWGVYPDNAAVAEAFFPCWHRARQYALRRNSQCHEELLLVREVTVGFVPGEIRMEPPCLDLTPTR